MNKKLTDIIKFKSQYNYVMNKLNLLSLTHMTTNKYVIKCFKLIYTSLMLFTYHSSFIIINVDKEYV